MTSSTIKFVAAILAGTMIITPAQAQFGGMLAKAKAAALGGSSGTQSSSMSGDEADAFLADSFRSTKNVLIATLLIAAAVEGRGALTAAKVKAAAANKISDPKEIGASKSDLVASLAALNSRKDVGADFQASIETMSNDDKNLLGTAVVNLAIGIARNVELAGKAPGLINALKSNPKLMMRAAQFKTAAELVALQGKGLAGVAGSVPKLIAASKVRAPKDAKTSEFQALAL